MRKFNIKQQHLKALLKAIDVNKTKSGIYIESYQDSTFGIFATDGSLFLSYSLREAESPAKTFKLTVSSAKDLTPLLKVKNDIININIEGDKAKLVAGNECGYTNLTLNCDDVTTPMSWRQVLKQQQHSTPTHLPIFTVEYLSKLCGALPDKLVLLETYAAAAIIKTEDPLFLGMLAYGNPNAFRKEIE